MYNLHPLFHCASCGELIIGKAIFCIGSEPHTKMDEKIRCTYDVHGNHDQTEVVLLSGCQVGRTGSFLMPAPHLCDDVTSGFLRHVGYKSILLSDE